MTIAAALVLAALLVFVARQAGADDGPAVVSVADVTVNETDGASNASLTISLSHAAAADVTVNFATTDGSATQPDDYTQTNGSATIAAGGTSATIPVPITGNNKQQDDRAFSFGISLADGTDPAVATLDPAHSSALVSIIDDDWVVKIAATPDNAKAPENGGTIDFAVGLKNDLAAPANHKITVDYKIANDTAKRGTDYALVDPTDPTGTLTFAPGDTVKHIKVKGIDDSVFGSDKTFSVTLSNPVGAKLASGADSPQVGTITEITAPPKVGITSCASAVTAGNDAQLLVKMSALSQLPASLHYTTFDDSTTADDYEHVTNGDVVIAPGTQSTTISVHTKVNPPDGDRKFHVVLTDPQNSTLISAAGSRGDCTIHQAGTGGGGGGTLGTVSISGPGAVVEPAQGAAPINDVFSVTFTPPAAQSPTPQTVTVHWATSDGSATAPGDYTAASGTLTWTPGQVGARTLTVKVNPAGSTPDTDPETFTVTITADNANVATGAANATILPRGSTVSSLSVADAAASENAGSIPVKVTLAPAATGAVTVHYATADGSAAAGRDYTSTAGDLSFAAGETAKTVSIPVINDSAPEQDKTLTLSLTNANGAVIGRATATVTILNDDVLPPAIPVANTAPQLPAKPTQIPTQQPTPKTGQTHLVLPGIVNGTSKVDAHGKASFQVKCPDVVIRQCAGTIALDVRVLQAPPKAAKGSKPKAKPKPKLKTIRVGNGTFAINAGRTFAVSVKLTAPGLKVLRSLHRIKVKATIKATDGAGVKGVTAWIVVLVAPARSSQISVVLG